MLANTVTQSAQSNSPQEAESLEQLTALCKASGDRLRLEILQALRQDSLAVQELCTIFDMRQPAMSHHLKILAASGLVTSRREGNSIYYRRIVLRPEPTLEALQSTLFAALDQIKMNADQLAQLSGIQQARQQSSRDFFQQNADKFRAQQDLIASYDQYAATVAQALADAPLESRQLALEVGPGDGSFLSHLSPAFESVVALDTAAQMLARSRELAGEQGLSNIEFIHGDTRHPDLSSVKADCIVVNMVLHHTPSPADIFEDLANCLAADGVLLVTDLCQHDQDWARDACGDLWLGFEPADLTAWATRAGLKEIASEYLAQRNGFQIQVRLFGHQSTSKE